jgi:hypothetical protein
MSSPLGWGRVAAPICFSPETLLALNGGIKPVPYMLIMQSVILAMAATFACKAARGVLAGVG